MVCSHWTCYHKDWWFFSCHFHCVCVVLHVLWFWCYFHVKNVSALVVLGIVSTHSCVNEHCICTKTIHTHAISLCTMIFNHGDVNHCTWQVQEFNGWIRVHCQNVWFTEENSPLNGTALYICTYVYCQEVKRGCRQSYIYWKMSRVTMPPQLFLYQYLTTACMYMYYLPWTLPRSTSLLSWGLGIAIG